ncbi:transposase, partial [Halobacteriales archaeon SW_8_65_20]
QEETYNEVREQTQLHANLVQNARNKAADAVQSVVARWKQGEYAGKPHFSTPTIVYDKRCATFHDEYVSLATVDGRIEVEYVLPASDRDTPHSRYLDNDDYEVTGAELHHKDGEWFLHLRTKAEVESDTLEQATTGHSTVLGVDLGVNQLAVTSTGVFWNGHEFDHWRREYEKRRSDLQQCGSRHAHENIQAVGRKETGRFNMMLHRTANGIIKEATENGCTVIAFEELTGIRDRLSGASWGHEWTFERLYEYVEYKAEVHGIAVEQVDPENTSRRCSTCGFTHPDNRDGESFECLKCNYENHADYNAAKNIGLRYLRRTQTGDDGGAPVGVRLNRGTLNANGEYEPPAACGPREEAVSE